MSFANLIKKGSLRGFATATPATPATHGQESGATVATVATVAVATAQKQAANDPMHAEGLVTEQTASIELSSLATELPDPDRWCWPHSAAMTGREIDTMVERTHLFNRRGLAALDAELLADKLVTRDREGDARRLCMECAHLSRAGGLRCAQWQRAGLGAAGVPAGLQLVLQRCDGFKDQNT